VAEASGSEVRWLARRWALASVGLGAGFSGLAVVTTILTGWPLLVLELGFVGVVGVVLLVILRRTSPQVVQEVGRIVRAGALAGAAATIVYDVVRTVLSVFDPSPYNPFEAIRAFGVGVVGVAAPAWAHMTAGFIIHLVNGSSFGVIYAVFAGRRARGLSAALGIGALWGITLELVQSILYPGWLGITTVLREFLLISGLGHLAYGGTLGLGTRHLLFGTRRSKEHP
jgi:hypothetical protein